MKDNIEYLIEVIEYFGSQHDLATKLGVSKMLVSYWVHRKSQMQLKHALKIQLLTDGKFKYFKLLDKETQCYLMKK